MMLFCRYVSVKIFLLSVGLLWTTNSFACKELAASIDLSMKIERAENIYIGTVTGIHLIEYENMLKKEIPTEEVGISTFDLANTYTAKVFVHMIIKGLKKDSINIQLGHCGSGSVKMKAQIVVFEYDNMWFVKPYNPTIGMRLTNLQDVKAK